MYHVPLAFQSIHGSSNEGGENGDGKEGSEWKLPALLYADELVPSGESEEDLSEMVRQFVEVCLKVNTDKSNVMVLNGEEELECEV